MISVLQLSGIKNLRKIFRQIDVDTYGNKIMMPKAISYLIRINSLSNITANILKQEMLSLGGDVAVSRGALTGRSKKTDCLIICNASELKYLQHKLNQQPFGLNQLARDISLTIKNYQRNNFLLRLGRHKLNLTKGAHIMGIINLTPDSFSGDGFYSSSHASGNTHHILDFAQKLVRDGADIIDVGGESSRPKAVPVSVKEELNRTIPIIKILAKKIKIPISIDTYKPEVAKQALDCGAVMVNDISGLRNNKMAKVVARYKAALVIMHMKGEPLTMQQNPEYSSLIEEIAQFLSSAMKRAEDAGINREKIIIDPGIGFGKTSEHNLKILKRLKEFKVLGRPILVGPSRKSFIGKILKVQPDERIFGTVSACVLAVKNGANIIRVHDVKEVKQALKVLNRVDKC